MSNGATPQTQATLKIMRDMHPKRKKQLHTHEKSVNQVRITTAQAKRYLYRLSSRDQSSPGVFGWSASWLFPTRGQKQEGGRTTFIQQMARLVARLANAEVPPIVGFILSCGGIFALNKLSPTEQLKRPRNDLPPKLRPVNIGCSILKWALKLALQSHEARSAIEKLSPIQMGLKAAHGTETVAHLFRSLWEAGHIILTTDYSNGFNAFQRQAMLDAVEKRCPALTQLFNIYYALDSMCFFIIDGQVEIIYSEEGSRMGCILGSFGFDLTVPRHL
jgi:hypothetical protein